MLCILLVLHVSLGINEMGALLREALPARPWEQLTRSEDGRWIGSWKILEVIALYRLFDDKRYMSLWVSRPKSLILWSIKTYEVACLLVYRAIALLFSESLLVSALIKITFLEENPSRDDTASILIFPSKAGQEKWVLDLAEPSKTPNPGGEREAEPPFSSSAPMPGGCWKHLVVALYQLLHPI